MSTGGPEDHTHQLFHEIEKDFEALARLIGRAIEHLAVDGTTKADIERLVRAKALAERGAALAKMNSAGS